jgi:hypothetical protein
MTSRRASRPIGGRCNHPDFKAVNQAAMAALPSLLRRWLPNGRIEGNEYVAHNPRRSDRHHGSFKINLRTGRWADFACDARGGDPVSLSAYLSGLSQTEAALRLSTMLEMDPGGHHGR